MMTGKSCKHHCGNFARVCGKIVDDSDADLLFACEVGAFRRGFKREGIHGARLQKSDADLFFASRVATAGGRPLR